jgi:hypothetical protein
VRANAVMTAPRTRILFFMFMFNYCWFGHRLIALPRLFYPGKSKTPQKKQVPAGKVIRRPGLEE